MSFLGIDTETGVVHPVLPQDTEVPVVLEAGMIDSAQRPTFDTLFLQVFCTSGREIVPNTGADAPKFFTLATKS